MFSEFPSKIQTAEDFASIDDKQWNEFVRKGTKFNSWEEMQQEAAFEWEARKLGF